MKKFMNPEMDVKELDLVDVIATSAGTNEPVVCDDDCATYSCPNDSGCPLD